MLNPYAANPNSSTRSSHLTGGSFSPIISAIIRLPKPEKAPLIITISTELLLLIILVQLFSNPQQIHAPITKTEPGLKRTGFLKAQHGARHGKRFMIFKRVRSKTVPALMHYVKLIAIYSTVPGSSAGCRKSGITVFYRRFTTSVIFLKSRVSKSPNSAVLICFPLKK